MQNLHAFYARRRSLEKTPQKVSWKKKCSRRKHFTSWFNVVCVRKTLTNSLIPTKKDLFHFRSFLRRRQCPIYNAFIQPLRPIKTVDVIKSWLFWNVSLFPDSSSVFILNLNETKALLWGRTSFKYSTSSKRKSFHLQFSRLVENVKSVSSAMFQFSFCTWQ